MVDVGQGVGYPCFTCLFIFHTIGENQLSFSHFFPFPLNNLINYFLDFWKCSTIFFSFTMEVFKEYVKVMLNRAFV